MKSRANIFALCLCAAAIAYLLYGWFGTVLRQRPEITAVDRVDGKQSLITGSGFAEGGVYLTTTPASYKGALHFFGSWLGSRKSVGAVTSAWYKATPRFNIFIAGYPHQVNNQIVAEVSTADLSTVRVPLMPAYDPGELWLREDVSLRQVSNAIRFRIVAINGCNCDAGWIGFSEPFAVQSEDWVALVKQAVVLLLATSSAVLFFLFPGLVLRQKCARNGKQISLIWLPVPGLSGLALLGLIAWAGPRAITPKVIIDCGLGLLAIYAVVNFIRIPMESYISAVEQKILLAIVVLIVLGVAKSTYSLGPIGELYRDSISKTLEADGRSDSRISYIDVQLVGLRSKPYSEFANSVFAPYNFSDRGPLAGLAASTIALSGPVQVVAAAPSQPWAVFDPEGFSAYRVGMIAVACCSLIFVFGLARLFLPEDWSFFAFLIAASAPFIVHEIYFTWPKLEAGGFTLLGAYLVLQHRYFLAGLAVGAGYLYHPAALLSTPALLVLVVLSSIQRGSLLRAKLMANAWGWIWHGLSMAAGALVWMSAWRRINRRHFTQGGFTGYLFQADRQTLTIAHWLQSRYDSLANTLIPFNVVLFHRDNWALNSVAGHSPLLVQFFLQYAVALPFGGGIFFFPCLLWLAYLAWKKQRAWLLLVFVLPLLLFALYFGASRTGLLREGLHAWFLGLVIFLVVIWRQFAVDSRRFWAVAKWCLMLRGGEVVAMLLLPSIWSTGKLAEQQFVLTDALAIAAMIFATAFLYYSIFVTAGQLSQSTFAREINRQ